MTTQEWQPTERTGPGRAAASAGSTPSGRWLTHPARWARLGGAFVCGVAVVPLGYGAVLVLFPCDYLFCDLGAKLVVFFMAVPALCGVAAGLVAPAGNWGAAGCGAMVAGLVVSNVGMAVLEMGWWSFGPLALLGVFLLSIPFGVILWVRFAWADRHRERRRDTPAG